MIHNPTQENVDAFNAFYEHIPGYRPIQFNSKGKLIG